MILLYLKFRTLKLNFLNFIFICLIDYFNEPVLSLFYKLKKNGKKILVMSNLMKKLFISYKLIVIIGFFGLVNF